MPEENTDNTETLEAQIESVLFWKAEPVKISDLAKLLSVKESDVRESLASLQNSLRTNNRGLSVITTEETAALVTSAESSELIEGLQKEELTKDLSKAALETFSIILYRGPMKRSDIDYVRGVNSQFILRTLLVRGLIEKKSVANAYVYEVSVDALAHLGVQNVKELPEYEQINTDVENFLSAEEVEEETS